MTTTKKHRIAKDVKEQILKRIKDDGIPVTQAAEEHGVSIQSIYAWLTKGVSTGPSWLEIVKLKKENKALFELVGEITMKLSQTQKKN